MGSVIGCPHGPFRDVLAPVHSFYLFWYGFAIVTRRVRLILCGRNVNLLSFRGAEPRMYDALENP